MTRLPTPGGDNGNWGSILNDFLSTAHNTDGTLKDNSVTKAKLSSSVQTSLDLADTAIPASQKGTASGVATLDTASKLTTSQLPDAVATTTEADALARRSRFIPARLGTLANVAYTNPSINNLVGISRDGARLYFGRQGFSAGQLGVSTDGGANITWGENFGGSNGIISGVTELNDGEVDVSVQYRDDTAGEIFTSTGFNTATADATAWTSILTASGVGNHFDGRWGCTQNCVAPSWSPAAGYRFYCEYGTKIDVAATRAEAATRCWMVDSDHTATEIFDLGDQYPALSSALHSHGCCYDPYDDAVAITSGDGGGTDGHADIWYKAREDLADGALWTSLAHSTSGSTQCTPIAALPGGLLALSDYATAGVRFIPRTGFREFGPIETVYDDVPGSGPIGTTIHTDTERPGKPAILTFQSASGSGAPFILATVDGRDVVQIHREAGSVTGSAPGIRMAHLAADGKVYAHRNMGDGSNVLLAGDWVDTLLGDRSVESGVGLTGGGTLDTDKTLTVVSAAMASRYGLLAHTYQREHGGSASTALTDGTLYVWRVVAEDDAASAARTVRLWQIASASAATLVKTAVFDSTGAQLGVSADVDTTFNSAGPTQRSISTGTFAVTKGATLYLALLVVGSGTVTLGRSGNNGIGNAGLTGAALNYATAGTGLSDMPSTITPASLSAWSDAVWAGLL